MKTVQVLMSSYNGEKYIREQIDSILAQQGVNVKLLVRDDGSKDGTLSILKDYENKGKLTLIEGNNIGPAKSFFALISKAVDADYYALSDQDDVWDEDKLTVAIKKMEIVNNPYVIYSSNTRLVDDNKKFIKNETLKPITTLGSAFVKNYVTGCTTVFNKNLLLRLQEYCPTESIKCHDWWINLVALSLDGVSIYDETPHISYRQHGENVTGAATTFFDKWVNRLKRFANHQYFRNEYASQILEHYHDIKMDQKNLLLKIANYKNNKLSVLTCKEFKSNSNIDSFLFKALIILNKA